MDHLDPQRAPSPMESTFNVQRGPETAFRLGGFSIDEYRRMKVVVIGAGFAGVIASCRFAKEVPNLELVVYEKESGVGGTWHNNKYPGVACDIPSHSYQIPFENNTQWSSFYAPGAEIRNYIEDVVSKNDLMKYIKLEHELVAARWEDETGKWLLKIRSHGTNEIEDTADVLLLATGILNRWQWPQIEGLSDFQGILLHSANWKGDTDEWKDKTVGVIGAGSSAIQIVPALQPKVKRVVNYVRSRTWLGLPWGPPRLNELIGKEATDTEYVFSDVDRERFKDPVVYKEFRRELEMVMTGFHAVTKPDSDMQRGVREFYEAEMKRRLSKKPWIADHLIPEFAVGCRRVTPGPGYLEALCQDNVDFVHEAIKRVTADGIETNDGAHIKLDVIVCATGFDLWCQYPFPVVGKKNLSLQEKFKPHPTTYLALCVDEFPNFFLVGGPNGCLTSSSYLTFLDKKVMYVVEATKKLQRERLKSIVVKKDAVDDFDEYLESYFPTTVHAQTCRTWFKGGQEQGRVIALWPGSGLHAIRALSYPRWEDFEYEKLDKFRNRLHWLGDGQTVFEKTMKGNRAWYLDEYF